MINERRDAGVGERQIRPQDRVRLTKGSDMNYRLSGSYACSILTENILDVTITFVGAQRTGNMGRQEKGKGEHA